ncbi:MAG: hypothetical protein ACYDCI_00445 [Candidatus Limnocylindrales bacterium]
MSTKTQFAVPVNALVLARRGDARALLAIPDARADLPRLIEGRTRSRLAGPPASEFGPRKAVAEAKALVIAREARRRDRQIAEKARLSATGVVAAMARKKAEGWIAATLGDLLDRHYRCAESRWAGGETSNHITLSDAAGASAETRKVWSKNGKWSGSNLYRRINVSPRWRREVYERQLAVVDGLVTTHAAPIESPEGTELYRATWVRQSRGRSFQPESGIIARHTASDTAYHSPGADPRRAVAGLKRKLTAQGVPADVRHARAQGAAAKRAEHRAAQLQRLVDRVRAHDLGEVADVVVRRDDSLRAGNCGPGTDQFIDRFFADRSPDSSATIGEIARRVGAADHAMLAPNLTLARQLAAACLIAIRRDKQARRRLAAV